MPPRVASGASEGNALTDFGWASSDTRLDFIQSGTRSRDSWRIGSLSRLPLNQRLAIRGTDGDGRGEAGGVNSDEREIYLGQDETGCWFWWTSSGLWRWVMGCSSR